MLGRRSHGEKTSNGKPVKKLIKTAKEEVVLGRGTQQSKAPRAGCFFCVVFPIQGTRAPLTLNSPFTVFEKRGFQKHEQWWNSILYIKNTYRLQIYF